MYSYPIAVAVRFNDQINELNLEGLSELMTEDHRFVDSAGDEVVGKKEMTKGWADFFRQFPDYRNIFTRIESRDNLVIMVGRSVCTEESLNGPAIWTALIKDDRVEEWRVYKDNEETRKKLDLP
jgi:ketosteroid isomerase-like protein